MTSATQIKVEKIASSWKNRLLDQNTLDIADSLFIQFLIHDKEKVYPLLYQESIDNIKTLFQNIIELLPKFAIIVISRTPDCADQIEVVNSGIDLFRYKDLISELTFPVGIYSMIDPEGTRFILQLDHQNKAPSVNHIHKATIVPYYSEIRTIITNYWGMKNSFILLLDQVLNEHYQDEDFDLQQWSKIMTLSTSQLFRKVKEQKGMAPGRYLTHFRLNKAKGKLSVTNWTISEISINCGFKSLSHFDVAFKKQFGMIPSSYRLDPKK